MVEVEAGDDDMSSPPLTVETPRTLCNNSLAATVNPGTQTPHNNTNNTMHNNTRTPQRTVENHLLAKVLPTEGSDEAISGLWLTFKAQSTFQKLKVTFVL